MMSAPSRIPPGEAPDERLRLALVAIALAAGVPSVLAVVSGLADPATGVADFLLAGLFLLGGIAGALALRLWRAARERQLLLERLELLQDVSWEISDRGGRSAAEAAIPIATVSHEMRAPLHGMLALSDLLAATPLSPEQRSYLTALNQSAGGLARLVDDLLDASRIATGQFSLNGAPTEIEALVEDVAALLAPLAHERGIGIGARVVPGLPPVVIDAGRLRQVLINLVTNAIQATERGAVLITVDEADQPRETGIALTFAVHDSGRGVAAADRARIFASFERGGSSGMGLGLSISQQIVRRMGAEIRLEPRAGGGSLFHFTLALPTIDGNRGTSGAVAHGWPHVPEPVGARLVHAASAAEKLKDLPLLLIMPASLEADALVAALGAAGAETRLAVSLSEAVGLVGAAAAAGLPYRMVLADARIVPAARSALNRLRQANGAQLPVALLTGCGDRQAAEALEADGFDAYLVRPVRRASLLQVVDEATRWPHRFVADPADAVAEPAPVRGGIVQLQVLVVEDDPVSALLARAVLERLGHEVNEVGSLNAARALSTAARPDVALIDLSLPDGDGLALIRDFAIHGHGGVRPAIIATSGRSDAQREAEALAAGADLFLEKPISAERLCRAFEEALARAGEADSARHQTA